VSEPSRTVQVGDEQIEIPEILPVLPVRDAVAFPGATLSLAVGRPGSLAALDEAGTGGLLVVATQSDPAQDEPSLEDLHPVACIARALRIVAPGNDGRQVLVVGILRTRFRPAPGQGPLVRVHLDPMEDTATETPERETEWRRVVELGKNVIDLRDDMPDEWKAFVESLPDPGLLADLVASTLPLSVEDRLLLLSEPDATRRLRVVAQHLEREVTIAHAQRELRSESASDEVDPRRRERLLRRRLREIQNELGESDSGLGEVDELRDRLDAAELPDEALGAAERELKRLAALPQHAPDRHMIRTYLEWMIELPWSVETEDRLDLHAARETLDEDHHDLEKVKDRILEYLAVRKLAPEAKGPILCFVGPPGVGKTSLGRSIARALERRFARASLGGVRDEAEIRGHRRTYVGAMPGRILQSLRRAGSRNPVFLLDEVDKLGADFRGDPSSALLEVLDPEQNHSFSDHYLEVPFDLSRMMFIATANTLSTIPPALLDRMEVIELPGYTDRDKQVIATRHLVPKQLEAHGLRGDQVEMHDEALGTIVHEYTREAGVRNLERHIATTVRKAARRVAEAGGDAHVVIDSAFVSESLGAPPHLPETTERTQRPGVAVGLARTAVGGDILFIEATAIPGGKGVRLRLTGQLGDVMRESAEAALSWIRANAVRLGLGSSVLEQGELHLHVPAGAVPKDGPSAGVALVVAMVSVLSGRRAHGDVAMTGEISLRGRVLPVGGIKDKLLAAERAGVRKVILPRRNEKDLVEVPAEVLEKLDVHFADEIDEALWAALETPDAESPAQPSQT
jgi:ATP-dependent Lon protease